MNRESLVNKIGSHDLSWEETHSIIDELVESINETENLYDAIIGINRGGLIPSVLMSHKLDIQHGVTTVESYQGKNKGEHKIDQHVSILQKLDSDTRILLVDDIADTGFSLFEVIKELTKLGCDEENIDTATLHYKPKSIFKPTYIGDWANNELWIYYPWEQKK